MRRVVVGVILILTSLQILVTGVPAMASGFPNANTYGLTTGPTFQTYADPVHKYVSYTFTLVNGSSRDADIRQIGQNGPGMQLLVSVGSGMASKLVPPTGPGRIQTVLAHKSRRLTVWFRISNCATVPKGSWPLKMDVGWSPQKLLRVSLTMTSAGSLQWQKFLADSVCP